MKKTRNKYWYLGVEQKAKVAETQEAALIQEYFHLDGEQM